MLSTTISLNILGSLALPVSTYTIIRSVAQSCLTSINISVDSSPSGRYTSISLVIFCSKVKADCRRRTVIKLKTAIVAKAFFKIILV